MKTKLIIIDPQNDFCSPNGNLYVRGADADMLRMANFITQNKKKIDNILISTDKHEHDHIGHPCFFTNKNSEHPKPFTRITYMDLSTRKWMTTNPEHTVSVMEYLKNIKEHTIWPYHCLVRTIGQQITHEIQKAISIFDPKMVSFIDKGTNRLIEEYSIMAKKFNHDAVLQIIHNSDLVLIGGEAGSHCVADSLIDIHKALSLKGEGALLKNIVLLEDTISPVPGFEHLQTEAFKTLTLAGTKISNTKEMTKKLS